MASAPTRDDVIQRATHLRMKYAEQYGHECDLGIDDLEVMMKRHNMDDAKIIENMREDDPAAESGDSDDKESA